MSKKKEKYIFSVIIEQDESGNFVGNIPALKSCYTQAKTLPELYIRLQEVVSLSLEVEKKIFNTEILQSTFVGVQQLEFTN